MERSRRRRAAPWFARPLGGRWLRSQLINNVVAALDKTSVASPPDPGRNLTFIHQWADKVDPRLVIPATVTAAKGYRFHLAEPELSGLA